jgi:hypothetical protein
MAYDMRALVLKECGWHAAEARALWTGIALLYVSTALPLHAQQSTTPSNDSATIAAAMKRINTRGDSAAMARAAAIADTGRMTPGYRDISRYDTPGYCVAAMRGITMETWRSGEGNLIVTGSAQDTVPTKAKVIGTQCMAHLPDVQQIAVQELPNMMRLAMFVGDTAVMQAVINRQFSLATTDEARGYVLSDAVHDLVDPTTRVPHPLYVAMATNVLRRLDALGAGARIQRLIAHREMLHIATEVRFDTTALLREDAALRRIGPLLTAEDRKEYDIANEYDITLTGDSLYILWYRNDPDFKAHVHAFMEKMQVPLSNSLGENVFQSLKGLVEMHASKVGTPAPPIRGKYWFPADSPHVAPKPGKVTLVREVTKGRGIMDPYIASLLRLYNKYHAKGLEIVLVLKTQGYSWSSPPQSAEDEAKTIAWYYLDHLQLPFTVVVDETPFTKKPDGRRVAGQIAFEQDYVMHGALIGRDGRIRTIAYGLTSESMEDAFIRQALDVDSKTVHK